MNYELIKEYTGLCKLDFVLDQKITLDSKFNLKQYSNGRIIIKCSLDISTPLWGEVVNMNNRGVVMVDLHGELEELNGKITAKRSVIDKINISVDKKRSIAKCDVFLLANNSVEIVFKEDIPYKKMHIGLTNFIFRGCEKFKTDEFSFKIDRFRANIGSHEILFIQKENYKSLYDELVSKKGILVTSEAVLSISESNYSEIEELTDNLCFLLSYASRTMISPIYEDFFSNGVLTRSILKPLLTRNYNHQDRVIDSRHMGHCDLKAFLESIFDKYLIHKDELGLPIVIDYYLESARSTYLETKFLIGITALECLLSHFEDKIEKEGNPLLINSLRMNKSKILKIMERDTVEIPKDTLEEIVQAVSFPSSFLNDKLKAVIDYYNIGHENYDFDLIRIRNNIVHEGKFPEEIKFNGSKRRLDNREEFNRLINLIDRIILSILNYHGKFYLDKRKKYQRVSLE